MGRLQSAKQIFTNIFPRKSVTKMEFYQEADFYELSEMLDDDSSRSSSPYFVHSPPAANMVKIERVPSAHGIGKRRPGKAPSRPDWDLDPVELDRRERRRPLPEQATRKGQRPRRSSSRPSTSDARIDQSKRSAPKGARQAPTTRTTTTKTTNGQLPTHQVGRLRRHIHPAHLGHF